LKQLTENDLRGLLATFRKLNTQMVLMSGGEALLNPNFFRFCEILKKQNIKVSLLSTGLTLKKNAEQLLQWVNDIVVSLDGNEATHDRIRNIPGAFHKLKEGVQHLKSINPAFRITSRTVIHRINFRLWPDIIDCAKEMGIDQASFLPADVSSHAFNREVLWSEQRQHELVPAEMELAEFRILTEYVIEKYRAAFQTRFIAESPEKLRKIYQYYAACHGLNSFPYKKCNAPWVSAVVEADGTVRPCFFHEAIGNIREKELHQVLNSEEAIQFRRELDMDHDDICKKCVCYINLAPAANLQKDHS
jgi:MoaA/NifB/PqqE/SkfB family radical SAM enzyme